jgi:hypothetical protein
LTLRTRAGGSATRRGSSASTVAGQRGIRRSGAQRVEHGRGVEAEDRLEDALRNGHDGGLARTGRSEEGAARVGRDEGHIRSAHEYGRLGPLQRVDDAGERMERLLGLFPALDAAEVRQVGARLADDGDAIAHPANGRQRIRDERAPGHLHRGLRPGAQALSGSTCQHSTDHGAAD